MPKQSCTGFGAIYMAILPNFRASHRWCDGLLGSGEPNAVQIEGHDNAPFILICDHGGNRIPDSLSDLGVSLQDRERHIGWDIGALGVARAMAERLGSLLVHQPYSRLVIDCNRPPHVAQAFPNRVDGTYVPGNVAMTCANAAARVGEIFHPYHAAIAAILDARAERETILVSVHSYTPDHGDHPGPRPWPVSLLFDKDRRFSDALAFQLQLKNVTVGINQPYVVDALGDYAIPVHGEGRGLLHTLIEVRQDLIEGEAGQHYWGQELADCVRAARSSLFEQKEFSHGAG